MHKLVVLYPPPNDPEAFRSYYTQTHIPLVRQLPGLRRYGYSFEVASPAGDSPFFCVFEAEWDDAAAMRESMTSEQGQLVAADVPNYAPDGVVMIDYELTTGS